MKIAFLGLGVMGYPMAGHLQNSGHDVRVYNRTTLKSQKWIEQYAGEYAGSIGEACHTANIAFACVGNDEDSEAVAKQALSSLSAGSIYVDHTTTSAQCAEKISAMASEKGVRFIDAPVSGGEAGAIQGTLSVMCGGEAHDISVVSPVMDAYAKRIIHIGQTGHGQLCKATNQIAIAGLLQGLSEAVHFAEATGINMQKTLEAISGGAAQSWQMENRWETMTQREFDFGFAVKWMRKDLDIVFSEAKRFGVTLPTTYQVDQNYKKVEENGGAGFDTSSLVTLLEKNKKST